MCIRDRHRETLGEKDIRQEQECRLWGLLTLSDGTGLFDSELAQAVLQSAARYAEKRGRSSWAGYFAATALQGFQNMTVFHVSEASEIPGIRQGNRF